MSVNLEELPAYAARELGRVQNAPRHTDMTRNELIPALDGPAADAIAE